MAKENKNSEVKNTQKGGSIGNPKNEGSYPEIINIIKYLIKGAFKQK